MGTACIHYLNTRLLKSALTQQSPLHFFSALQVSTLHSWDFTFLLLSIHHSYPFLFASSTPTVFLHSIATLYTENAV